jgi:hypothetical protein
LRIIFYESRDEEVLSDKNSYGDIISITITSHKDSREYWPQKMPGHIRSYDIQLHYLRARRRLQNMAVEWSHDVDATLSKAKSEIRSVLLDFSAAPV